MIEFVESGMCFGPYQEGNVFNIEKSQLYKGMGAGIKTVEFVLIYNENTLGFIEAKSSSPKPEKENKVDFNDFIKEISEKFLHSFNLYYANIMGRHGENDELSNEFLQLNNKRIMIKFILVIKGHETIWLAPIKEELERTLLFHNKIWKCEIAVLNDILASQYGLIKENIIVNEFINHS